MWSILIDGVFGNFWMAVIGVAVVIFIIMAILGRMSMYTVTWYLAMFFLAMILGWGEPIFSGLISLLIIASFIFAAKGYFDNR